MTINLEDKKSHLEQIILGKQEEGAAKKMAKSFGLAYSDLFLRPVDSSALSTIPKSEAQKTGVAIVQKRGGKAVLAVLDPGDPETKNLIRTLRNKIGEIKLLVVSKRSLKKAWAAYPRAKQVKKISGSMDISEQVFENFLKKIKNTSDLKRAVSEISKSKDASSIVELLLSGALSLDASDVHIEPLGDKAKLRLRIDGILSDIAYIDQHSYKLLISRIKLLSGLKINVRNIAQDGRFSVLLKRNEVQTRTSILPGEYGENIVMRVLAPQSLLNIKKLGIREDIIEKVLNRLKEPDGLILATGPTGSGKTTTLYAFLKEIKTPEIKIITIEDPIEYHIEGVTQTQVKPDKGYSFSNGLRSILRQDPNVILLGEIRDPETADTALQASLTGHLVLSTLHANDAAGVIPRLIDLGAKSGAISSALSIAIAQRLIRRACENCKKTRKPTEDELFLLQKELKQFFGNKNIGAIEITEAQGCSLCDNTGYKGRIGIYEIIIITPEIGELISSSPTESAIKNFIEKSGIKTLRQDGLLRVLEGITTIEEIERVVGEEN